MSENARTYPKFPIPAVGAIILNGNHVLLIQRGQAPSKDKWTLPGGVVELGETPEEALIREIREECHLDIQLQGIAKVVNRVIKDENGQIKYHYLILDYLAYCQTEQLCSESSLQAGSDVKDARWIPLEEIVSYDVTEGLRDVIYDVVKRRKYLEYSDNPTD
jgi:ADP-ribose pyrophosphatase YjhB (NUDIX family)